MKILSLPLGPKHSLSCLLVSISAMALAGCANTGRSSSQASGPLALTPQQIAEIVASPDRSAADRTNDLRRKPEQMLAFLAIRHGMTVLDLSTGGGYTTELLARAVGPTGSAYGQSHPPRAVGRLRPNVTAGANRYETACEAAASWWV